MATPRIGYAEAASWMARDVDNETLVYRRFDELATRNLLYLQSELLSLEHQLNELDREDAEDEDMDWQMVVCDWEKLGELADARENGVRIGRYEEHSISIAVAVISTLIAAILLIGSITGLYFVKSDAAKLGLIAFFTSLFALSVGVTTNARRAEIFAGTAAYAAVLVVFVSGDLSSSQGS
ncbi:hypothetical protein CGLO_15629 [Colletotrichum gloeosporioides Cg-14]|uniref:DUF6594 domain-containing protein n=1 Tax=Colletotrichum gloeosporioides (strain Cg-14) TaxID=1237896 RepID=T0JYJ3_COLGC|nr:hypothetical protein CGLO_15629 [Colletotrichum gloeosporioides Cg-14]